MKHGGKHPRVYISVLMSVCMAFSFSACRNNSSIDPNATDTPAKVTSLPHQFRRTPLIVRDRVMPAEKVSIIYPVLSVNSAENLISNTTVINEKIEEEVNSILEDDTIVSIDYDTLYNDKGVFSMRFNVYHANESIPYVKTMTFDCDTGDLVSINMLFDENKGAWRRSISELVSQAVKAPLLSIVPPIRDSRSFYLTNDSLIIVYQMYELNTSRELQYISIKYDSLQEYIGKDSLLFRIMNTTG